MRKVSFDWLKLQRLKRAYARAPGDLNSVFTFDGQQYVKGFAKYLIQYLELQIHA